jgi:aquaporin Z
MNPTRPVGATLVAGRLDALWIYPAAPVFGAFLAHPACRWIQGDECCPEDRDRGDIGTDQ